MSELRGMEVPEYKTCSMKKQRMEYIATSVTGARTTLQHPNSDVRLEIPDGLIGAVKGTINLDPKPYLQHIPPSECLIAPIPDYTAYTRHTDVRSEEISTFKIRLRHIITNENDLKFIRVRHGDIHKDKAFIPIPNKCNAQDWDEAFWEADTEYIIITTRHFSQFLCTSCKVLCDNNVQAFVFGTLRDIPRSGVEVDMKVFLCPALFRLTDYRKVCDDLCN